MTITPDKAKTLIAESSARGSWTADHSAVKDHCGWSIFVDEENRTAATATPGDAALAAAAPDLARTVIDQAEKLRNIRVLAEALAARHEREDHGENAHETALFNAILGKKADDQ